MTSITVTKDTLSKTVVHFLAEVLRNNLTDSQSTPRNGNNWIFNSQPDDPVDKTSALPRIVLIPVDTSFNTINFPGSKKLSGAITIDAIVYTGGASALLYRDQYIDDIRTCFFNPDSVDADGKKIRENYLVLRTTREGGAEDFHSTHPKIIRSKRISMEFRYYGG